MVTTKEEKIVRFRNLSNPLKTAVVFAWIGGVLMSLAFLAGFFSGLMYA